MSNMLHNTHIQTKHWPVFNKPRSDHVSDTSTLFIIPNPPPVSRKHKHLVLTQEEEEEAVSAKSGVKKGSGVKTYLWVWSLPCEWLVTSERADLELFQHMGSPSIY